MDNFKLKKLQTFVSYQEVLRQSPIEDQAIPGFSGQKSVPE